MTRYRWSVVLVSAVALLSLGGPALASVQEAARPALGLWWYLAFLASISALVVAWRFFRGIREADPGTARMQEIAAYVREGAYAYLRRQYAVVGMVFVVLALLLGWMSFGLHLQHPIVPFAFLSGGLFSGLAGFIGMKTATMASNRTAQGASQSLNRGLTIAFRAGAVMGLTVVGLALLDITVWLLYLYSGHHRVFGGEPMSLETITTTMLCFGVGASTQALFARVGGGIFTKAADVGADLVGKVESGIPEDDPRNPATIADNVGDNVGDVAGMGADLYESYAGSILATAALGVAAVLSIGGSVEQILSYIAAPLLVAAVGTGLSIAGIYVVRTREDASMGVLLAALNRGIYLATFGMILAAYVVVAVLGMPQMFWSIATGLVLGIVIGKGTEYATASEYRPTQRIAEQSQTGPATVIIAGIAEGMLSTWIPILAVGVGTLMAFGLAGGFENLLMGLYGVGIAAVGMLSTLGITLATDAYGPIADNAGGNAEMAGLPKHVRHRTDALDALGNTTAAIGKGFAIGAAALTALALLASYIDQVRVSIHREAASQYAVSAEESYRLVPIGDSGKWGLFLAGASDSILSREQHTISGFRAPARAGVGWGELSDKAASSVDVVELRGPDGALMSLYINEVGSRAGAGLVAAGLIGAEDPGKLRRAGLESFVQYYRIDVMNPNMLVGMFMGMLLVLVFCALTMQAVGRSAFSMVQEVRRQFREKPGIMQGTETPDYARCVSISTAAAQREMILPSSLAILAPIGVGIVLDVAGVMGLLVGGLVGGFAIAVFMANAGGAWDNAKKYIEGGQLGGKGSDCHKASVVGDTVGDPFKDTSGPSLNILIKLMSMVSIVFAGTVVAYGPVVGQLLGLR